ncbi:hypothetical protein HDV63DRAFT_285865 [Trichoderma sp. SZMC 28014]
MQFSLSIATFVLAMTASAAPSVKRQNIIASGDNMQGTIFEFGDPAPARQALYQSGACGLSTYFPNAVDLSMPLIAMPAVIFDQFGAAQNDQLCAKIITMSNNGVTRQAAVADRNSFDSIDMTLDLWEAFGGHDNDGTIIPGFSWYISE